MAWQDEMRRAATDVLRRGDDLQRENRDRLNQDEQSAAQYQSQLDEFRRMLMEDGGFTAEEAAEIMQAEGFNSLLFGDQQAQDSFLTGDEEQESRGNPWAAKNAYNTEGIYSTLGSGIGNQRGAFQADSSGADAALSRMREGYRGAIDSADLGPGEYGDTVRGIFAGGRAGVTDPLERARLEAREGFDELGNRVGISDRFTDAMTVGDDEVQGIRNVAANRMRTGNERMIQNAQRRAAEGGNTNALAVAAFEQNARDATEQDAAAAATEAEIAARRYRRDSEDMLEARRMAGEMAGANLSATGLSTAVGLNRDLSGANRDLLGTEMNLEGDVEDRRYRGELAGLQAEMDAVGAIGAAGLNEAQQRRAGRAAMESELANRELGVADADLMRRVQLEEQGEERQQGRAAALGLNRQGTRQGNVDRRYQQNSQIYDRRGRMAGQIAGQRIDDRNRAGGILAGQQQQANTNAQQGRNRGVQIYGQQSGNYNDAMRNYGQARSQPGFWSRLATASAAGTAAAVGS